MGASWSAPVRNFFNRGKVKEEVAQGVEVVVNVVETGAEKLNQAAAGGVASLADELSNAGVDLNQFKNQQVEALEKDEQAIVEDVHKVENEVVNVAKKTMGTVENIGHGLKDEFQNAETQTEKVEKAAEAAKVAFTKTTESVVKKIEDPMVETISSMTSNVMSFGISSETKKEVPRDISAKREEPSSLLSQGLTSGIQKVEETASAIEKKLEDTSSSLLTKEKELVSSLTSFKDNVKEKVSEEKEELSSNLRTGITEVKDNLQTKKEDVSSSISAGVKQGEELATQGLGYLQDFLTTKKDDIASGLQHVKEVGAAGAEKVVADVDNFKKEANEKKTEVTSGLSSGLNFLRDTVVESKDVVVDAFQFGHQKKDGGEDKDLSKTSPPEFQSTQKPISTLFSSEEEKLVKSASGQNSLENSTNSIEESLDGEDEMDVQQEKKETSPIKEVSDFLKQEISDASKHIESKKEEVKQGVSELASAAASKAHVAKDTLADSFTDFSSTITNTLHNFETGIEKTGKNVLTDVGTKVKEAGDFIAGTEEEVDDDMDEKELKTEAVTSLLEKSFI